MPDNLRWSTSLPIRPPTMELKGMTERSPHDDLPETARAAFADRTLLSLPKTAALLNVHRETLSRMVTEGQITARQKGKGVKRRQFVFSIADIARYLRSAHRAEKRESDQRINLMYALSARRPGSPKVSITIRQRRKTKTKT